MAQYVGKDKWQKELDKQEEFIHSRVWKGNSTFTLESFIMQHRSAHIAIAMTRCAEQVPYQLLPNEWTRVTHLLNGIKTSDMELQSAIAVVKSDDGPDGKLESFEETAACLIKFDPVQAKRRRTGAQGKQIQISQEGLKKGTGKTGVKFIYHTPEEYRELNDEQKDELRTWRKEHKKKRSREDGDEVQKGKSKKHKKDFKKQLISALKELAKKGSESDNQGQSNDGASNDMIISVLSEAIRNSSAPLPPAPKGEVSKKPEVSLNGIVDRLKKAKM